MRKIPGWTCGLLGYLGIVSLIMAGAAEARVYAVVIGINHYQNPNLSTLSFAHRDARVLTETLVSVGRIPRQHIRLLLGKQATKSRILHALEHWLWHRVKATDTALIFFSGHGFTKDQVSYWAPYDNKAKDTSSHIPHLTINRLLRRLRARTTILFLDTCHSGPSPSSQQHQKKTTTQAFRADSYEHQQGRVVIASSRHDQHSCESSAVQHGIFSYVLLQALQGKADVDHNGVVTLWEVWRYLQQRVSPLALQMERCLQQPVLFGTLQHSVSLSFPGRQRAVGLSSEDVTGRDVALDRKGNIYITGSFTHHVVFAEKHLRSQGPNGIFVVKFDPRGRLLWALSSQGTGFEQVTGMAVHPDGTVALTGTLTGATRLGRLPVQGRGIFVARINKAGSFAWVRLLEVQGLLVPARVAVDASGRIGVVGSFSRTLSDGTRSLRTSRHPSVFAASFATTGKIRWLRSWGKHLRRAYGSDIAFDTHGNAHVAGSFDNQVQFGQKWLCQRGFWVAKISSQGRFLWANMATEGWGACRSLLSPVQLAVGAQAVYLTGVFFGALRVGTQLLQPKGAAMRLLARLSSQGQWLWARTMGGTQAWLGAASLTLDQKGNPYLAGNFSGTIRCGQFTLTAQAQSNDWFVVKLNPKGRWVWAISSLHGSASVNAVIVSRKGTLHLLGIRESRHILRDHAGQQTGMSVLYKSYLWTFQAPS